MKERWKFHYYFNLTPFSYMHPDLLLDKMDEITLETAMSEGLT
ncbi:hypothetical protein ABEX88_06180 [Priestia megaterium]